MLSSKAKYALRAVLVLAEDADAGGWTSSFEIAEREAIPRKFLEAILVQLRDRGFIESRRGPSGGHRLRIPAEELSAADIIRIMDGPIALTPCASRTQFRACDDCVDIRACRLRHLMQRVRDAAAGVLEGCSLAELMNVPTARTTLGSPVRRRA
ncbi:MAG: Rrf2 family transcriptional regulator [Alphaproteobacteria bacterium]|nr:Rrf2 family transcriptional regulator [Alphaproteobacteria bacterium]